MKKKSIIELIENRKSIRTYKDEILEVEVVKQLEELISNINKSGPFNNIIRYELVLLDEIGIKSINKLINYGFIKGCPAFIAGIMKEDYNYLVDFGYLMEELILKTTEFGLDTCWLGGSLNTSEFKEKLKIKGKETLPAIFSLGINAKKTRRFDNVIRSTLKGNNRKPWSSLFFESTTKKPLNSNDIGLYHNVLEMVRLAPSACNKQPWRIVKESNTYNFYLVRDTIYSESLKIRKRSDLQKMDMGIAMMHFEHTAKELGLLGKWEFIEERSEKKKRNFEYIISWIASV